MFDIDWPSVMYGLVSGVILTSVVLVVELLIEDIQREQQCQQSRGRKAQQSNSVQQ